VRRLLRVAVLACLLVPFAAMPVHASGTLDQQFTGTNNTFWVSSGYSPAMVFTAGATGQLSQVDLLLTAGAGLADDLTVEIWTVSGGQPSSHVAGATATVHPTTLSQAWVSVPIDAASVSGTQYAIVLKAPTTGLCADVECWTWWADSAGGYSGGGSFYTHDGGSTWVAQGRDFSFKTYVAGMVGVQIYLQGVGEGAAGSVSSSPAGLDCGSTCLAQFAVGSQLTLTAHPAQTAVFTRWDIGPCAGSTNPVCTFTVPSSDVEAGCTFTGLLDPTPGTPPPSGTPTPSSTPRASVHPSASPSGAPASAGPSAGASASAGVSDAPVTSAPASLAPGASPLPSAGPSSPASDSGGGPLLVVVALGLILAIGLVVAGFMRTRRPDPTPEAPSATPPAGPTDGPAAH
jgi:hypothetical protein